jgi:hypothetical protein
MQAAAVSAVLRRRMPKAGHRAYRPAPLVPVGSPVAASSGTVD